MRKNTRKQQIILITRFAMFLAIEAIICFVPFLGSIQIGPVAATLAMIPVVIAGCVFGPWFGGTLGLFAGLFSFIWWTFVDPGNASAILFTPWNAWNTEVMHTSYWTLVICFIPRALTGLIAGYLTKLLHKKWHNQLPVTILACVAGSLTNTILVLFGTYFLWGKNYATMAGIEYSTLFKAILVLVGTNGMFEAALAGIFGSAVSLPLYHLIKTNRVD